MQKNYKKYFPIFVLPTLLAFIIAFVIPFFMGLYLSFCNFKTIGSAKWVGLSNYLYVFRDSAGFLSALWFTVKVAIVGVVSTNVLAFALALLLTKGLKGTNVYRTIFFMPNLIGGIILGYIWQLLLNGILIRVAGVDLTFNSTFGYWGIIILYNWQKIGYLMIIYIAGIQSISGDILEAAKIDGCNSLKTLWYVIVPMLKPSLVSCALFQFMWTSNDFMGPLIYISDMDKYTNSIYLRMSMDGDVGFQWNRILAMSLISIIPSLVVFFCAQDSFIDGIAAGGVKG